MVCSWSQFIRPPVSNLSSEARVKLAGIDRPEVLPHSPQPVHVCDQKTVLRLTKRDILAGEASDGNGNKRSSLLLPPILRYQL